MEGECHHRAMAVDNYGPTNYISGSGFRDNCANYGHSAWLTLTPPLFSLNELESYGFITWLALQSYSIMSYGAFIFVD